MVRSFDGAAVLVTGGLGFVGSNLARRLVDWGARVTIADALLPGSGGNLFNVRDLIGKVDIHLGDIAHIGVAAALVKGQDFIFHLAGQNSHLGSMQDPVGDLEHNCRLTLTLLEACRVHNPQAAFIRAGTRQAYGKPAYLPVDENHSLQPLDINGINKTAEESYHALYARLYGIASCCVRLTNIIGPGMRIKDASQNFFGYWIRNVLEGKPIDVWNGNQLRDLLHVDDAVDALLRVASVSECAGQAFNVGGPQAVNLESLARLLLEVNGGGTIRLQSFPRERQAIDIGSYCATWSRIKEQLGWEPRTYLRDAMTHTLSYYRANLAHYL